MIFRSKEGKLIEINRRDYNNDSSYYNAIIETLYGKIESNAPKVIELDRIVSIIRNKIL
jgi:hypothetical protein